MKQKFALILVLVAATFAGAQLTLGSGGFSMPKKEKPVTSRTLVGQVTDKNDGPLPDAVVYLKDTKTLGVKSYVSQKDGSYRFNNLSMNIDYEVYAAAQSGKKSATRKLSQFDSRPEPRLNLKIE
jgi:Carboxypeptidase regulatory-like domain